MNATQMPSVAQLKPLVLAAIESSGGTATTTQIREHVQASPSLDSAQRAASHGSGRPGSEVGYRLRWAILDLTRRGAIKRVAPRLYSLTGGSGEGT
jgi:Mrr N-terminal domain